MKVQAAVAVGKEQPFIIKELELDEPRAGEARVRMVASGVCHTDAIVHDEWYPVPTPAVLGHEGAGVVEAVGPGVTSVSPGDKVVLSMSTCGVCEYCLNGHPAFCTGMWPLNFGARRMDGSTAFTDENGQPVGSHFFGQSSFAHYSNVMERSIVKVPDSTPLELLGPLGCGIQTGAGTVLNVLKPWPGSSFVVFGAGAVGLSGMLAAIASGATTVIAVDIVDSRLEFAKTLGATHTVNSKNEDAVARIKEITHGGAHFALDTTGNKVVFVQMLNSLRPLGHGAMVGAAAMGSEAAVDVGALLMTGIKLSIVLEGDAVPWTFIPRLISLHEKGLFPFDKLITKYKFEDINKAFADSASGVTIKPVLVY